MGATTHFQLTKPTDPNAPADLITIVGALADDTDAALKTVSDGKAAAVHNHDTLYPGQTGARASGTWAINVTGNAGYAPSAGNADTVDGQHFSYSDRGETLPYLWSADGATADNRLVHISRMGPHHSHNPSQSGISVIHFNMGTINAGQAKQQRFARSNDQYPVVSVNHPSTYLIATIAGLDNGGFTVEVRNSTNSTNHTNIFVIVHLVRAA